MDRYHELLEQLRLPVHPFLPQPRTSTPQVTAEQYFHARPVEVSVTVRRSVAHTHRRRHSVITSEVIVRGSEMVLSSSQQLVMAFTAVLLVFVLFPRMFGGGGSRDGQPFDPRISRKGAVTRAVFVYSRTLCLLVCVILDHKRSRGFFD